MEVIIMQGIVVADESRIIVEYDLFERVVNIVSAEIINECHNVPLILEPRLTERNYGEYEAAGYEEYPRYDFWNYDLDYHTPLSESVKEVFRRIYACLDDIRASHPGKCVVLAMHGGAARAVYCYFNGMPEDKDIIDLVTPNATPIRFKIADDAPPVTPIPD